MRSSPPHSSPRDPLSLSMSTNTCPAWLVPWNSTLTTSQHAARTAGLRGGDGHSGGEEVEHPPIGGVEDGCDVEQHPLWEVVAAVVEDGDLVSALAPHGFAHPHDGGAVDGSDLEDTRVAAEHLAALAS